MSYCRWSCEDFMCAVYCYEDVAGGFTTHVARMKPVLDVELPPPAPIAPGNFGAWFARSKAVLAWHKTAKHEPIGLPHDGESFNDPDAASAADRLQSLKDMGYCVPQYAIDALREEAATAT